MKKRLVLKKEIKERIEEDLFDLCCVVAGLLFIYLFVQIF